MSNDIIEGNAIKMNLCEKKILERVFDPYLALKKSKNRGSGFTFYKNNLPSISTNTTLGCLITIINSKITTIRFRIFLIRAKTPFYGCCSG